MWLIMHHVVFELATCDCPRWTFLSQNTSKFGYEEAGLSYCLRAFFFCLLFFPRSKRSQGSAEVQPPIDSKSAVVSECHGVPKMQGLSWLMIPVFYSARERADFKRKCLSDSAFGSDPSLDMRCHESNFSSSELTPPLDSHSFSDSIWSEREGKWRLAVRATLRMISVPLSDSRLANAHRRVMNFCLETFLQRQNSKGPFECSLKDLTLNVNPQFGKKKSQILKKALGLMISNSSSSASAIPKSWFSF